MNYAVLKGAGYILVHAPDMVLRNGTTQTTEMVVNPESEYLKALPGCLRPFEKVLSYPPNRVFIGSMTPHELSAIPFPWYDKEAPEVSRFARFGEIMPEDEFIGLIQIVDAFDLVKLDVVFAADVREKLLKHPLLGDLCDKLSDGLDLAEIESLISDHHAEGLYFNDKLVGCVKRAHDIDINLSAHVILENLASKASAVLALKNLADKSGVSLTDVDYVIECSEEACGDMNQRGGGNFAKAIAEIAGAVNATGSDSRGFCAAPTHALIMAASLVKAGTFENVVVVAGGSVAKLGMNAKDHVKKGIPVLEDVLAGFAVLVSKDDGICPVLNTDVVGRHTVGTGSAPQAVISSLVTAPLDKAGLKITDIDKYSVEMQNPDITKPAGAGNVPESNYKMIAALSVLRNEIERSDINAFIEKYGMTGFAPTQGHIPSGVPYLGFALEALTSGNFNKVMIVGKGSLFLGRMTNLFDGVSILMERNIAAGTQGDGSLVFADEHKRTVPLCSVTVPSNCRIGLTTYGSEHDPGVLFEGARLAAQDNSDIEVVLIGASAPEGCKLPHNASVIETTEADVHKKMEELLDSGFIHGCVTAHYNFPIGVATVGKVTTPGLGREVFLATTTGTAATDRIEAMVLGAIYGITAAKACGTEAPTVGVMNLDGAMNVIGALQKLKVGGYGIKFSDSQRADGGAALRGNDLLSGSADVMVADTLTGNILIKTLSSFTTGGSYESVGCGYGPGLGENYDRLVMILSRASGSPVAAGAIKYAASLVRGDIRSVLKAELGSAKKAGLSDIITSLKKTGAPVEDVIVPDKEIVTEEIAGIDVMSLEDAVTALYKAGIYAQSGMGCTGPVVLVNEKKRDFAIDALKKAGYIFD